MFNKILTIVVLIGICIALLFIINFIFNKVLKWSNNIHLKFLKSFIDVVVVTVFTCTYLSHFEFTKDISKTLMQSGTLLIAVASFTAQRVLSNVISGVAITSAKPFNIGDKIKVISVNGCLVSEGIVTDINLRHTVVKKYDGQCDIIPNSIMDSSIISNTNLIENIGKFIDIGVSHDSDLDIACLLIKEIIVSNSLTLNTSEDTFVLIKDFTSEGVILRVLVQTSSLDDSFRACSEIRKQLLLSLKEVGIVVS